MSLTIKLYDPTSTYANAPLFRTNITHNLGKMATEAGIYNSLWRPYRLMPGYHGISQDNREEEWKFEESVQVKAKHISESISEGLKDMKKRPEHYKKFDSPNGWGTYEHFIPFVEEYLENLEEYPEAIVSISR